MRLLTILAVLLAACSHDCNPSENTDASYDVYDGGTDGDNVDADVPAGVPSKHAAAPARLRVTNKCEVPVWIQQQGFPTDPLLKLARNASHDYQIPAAGLASTRFWPKILCDKNGNNCAIGQSSPPCPATGCAPPVDSKLEVTWGCTLTDKSKCGYTPQGVRMLDTFWNASAVDGYTLPFSMSVKGGDGRKTCIPVDCTGLATAKCPTDEDLSNGGVNPKYAHQNLATKNPATGGYAGCFSTCNKLNYPGWGGDGLNAPAGTVEQMYCCPTPPISAAMCSAGPVAKTKYVTSIHKACKNTTYGYAYDDGLGGRVCSGDTVIEFVVGPKCVAVAAK